MWQPTTGVVGNHGYSYQWGAVEWFLIPQTNPNAGNQQDMTSQPHPETGTLIRFTAAHTARARQQSGQSGDAHYGLAPPPGGVPGPLIPNFQEMNVGHPPRPPTPIYTLTAPSTSPSRPGVSGEAPSLQPHRRRRIAIRVGSLQLTDVISFDVRIMFGQPAGITNIDAAGTSIDPFVTLWQAPFNLSNTAGGWNNGNPGFFPTNTTGPMVFDTWSSVKDGLPTDYSQWNVAGSATSIPLWNGLTGPVIKALQISIRIWDFKTNQTRQVTIVQAL